MRYCLFVFIFLLLSFFGHAQCPQSVKITASNPTICSGNSVTLTATPSGGSAPYKYTWSTGEISQTIDVNKAGTYKVTVTGSTPGCQPVTGTIDITVSPTPDAPTVANMTVCPNTSAPLKATAPGGFYQWYDAAGNFLISGDSYTTPALTGNKSYYVQTTVNGCTSARTQVFVTLSSKPNVTNATVCAGNRANLSADGGDTFDWYPNSSASGAPIFSGPTFTTPILNATTTYYVVATNDGCRSTPTAVTATVTTPPQKPVVLNTNPTVCSGLSVSLHAEDAPGVFAWYDVPTGGTALIYSPDFTTPPLTAPKTYYVQNSINDCESSRTAVTVNVTPIPAAPAPAIETTCAGTSTTITLPTLPSGTYQWYNAPSGGTPIYTGNSFITPVLNSATNYYVLANNGGCSSTRTLIKVVINPSPPVPSVSGAVICYNSATTLTATGPGGTYSWYNVASGGTAIVTNSPNGSFLTPALLTTTTYYVQTLLNGCTSARTPVTVTVMPQVVPPTASPTSTCSGNPAAITATGGSATATYDWYATQTGGASLFTGQVFVTPAITVNTTYYVQITDGGCSSKRTPVLVTVNAVPVAPTASGTTICPGTSANLSASASGTINWYDAPSGGSSLKTGSNFTTPILNTTTTFYVQNTTGTCASDRTPVVVTVNSPNNPQFQYPTGTVCTASPNVTPAINNPLGGTFSASSAGLVFISTTTGEINISASSPGNYAITFTGKGTCVVPQTSSFSIVTVANAAFSYKPGYCQDENNPRPTFNAGASAGNFSATPTGLVFVNTSTGEIDLKKSKGGNYTITNDIAASGGCASASASTSVIIYESVTVNAGPDQTVSVGTPVQLNGSITGGATTGKWSGGNGSFSNTSLKAAVYTPGAGETSATLTLTSDDPPGLCGPKTDKVVITFKTSPTSPTVTGNSTCIGSSATLTAIAPGGTYRWYDVATGGTSLKTSAVFVTPVLTSPATYYVETVNSVGVASPRTRVDVTVNAIPAAPAVTGAISVCVGNTTTLTTNNPAGSYEWYDAAVGGNKLSVTDTYTTPALTTAQTYYVQQIIKGCIGDRTRVDVTVSAIPTVTSSNADIVCSGNPLSYTITADVPAATFLWSRAQVTGISNATVTNQPGNTINETLINTSSDAVNVTYVITPMNGSCAGTQFNYVVTVYPTPTVTSGKAPQICNGMPVNYTITFNTITDFSWSRDVVPGITNAAVSGQASNTIKEALFNTTNAPIEVKYNITSSTSTCPGVPFTLKVIVNPDAQITSAATNPGACSGEPQNYTITSSIPSATFLWSRDVVNNISNDAVSNQTSPVIDEALVNTGNSAVKVTYVIIPVANGCPGVPFNYIVTVNPPVITPQPNVNSPICVGSTITLQTTAVAKATYTWTGSNGKTYNGQKVDIPNGTKADAGLYSLTIQVNGCTSVPRSVNLVVNDPPTVDAGPGKVVCIADPSIDLHGTIGGGVPTGIWTTVSGTGTFYPSVNYPATTQYIPTAADTAAGKVVLRLTATRKDECGGVSSDVTFQFGPLPAVFAGPDQPVCSQTDAVQLAGSTSIPSRVRWTTSGTGSFKPSDDQKTAVYVPGPGDAASGSVSLVLYALDAGRCDIPRDTMKINFIPPPSVNAGGTRYVLKNRTITLTPTVSDNNVTYLWTPNIDIDNNTAKNPVITGDVDRTYTLQVTDSRGCISTDTTFVKVSPLIVIPNTFTPNGDGVNDLWRIDGLIAYADATVDIYTRYGQKIYHSVGYDKPWDGVYNGKALPVGVYYYVINTKLFNQVFSGSLTLIR